MSGAGDPFPPESTPADLRAARAAVVALVLRHIHTVGSFHGGLYHEQMAAQHARENPDENPRREWPPLTRKQIRAALPKLRRLIAKAEAAVEPVRGELTVASGHVQSQHEQDIEYGKDCVTDAERLPPEAPTLDRREVGKWIGRAVTFVGGYEQGIRLRQPPGYRPA